MQKSPKLGGRCFIYDEIKVCHRLGVGYDDQVVMYAEESEARGSRSLGRSGVD